VARSLRTAFGELRVVGVDYWAGASGFHHDAFDDVWLKPSCDRSAGCGRALVRDTGPRVVSTRPDSGRALSACP
jgi:hypothetical protein